MQTELAELARMFRRNEMSRMPSALAKIQAGIERSSDLEEAKETALVVVAVFSNGVIERDGPEGVPMMHLLWAREIIACISPAEVAAAMVRWAKAVSQIRLQPSLCASKTRMQRAVDIIEARPSSRITDRSIAGELGLSLSHFRHQFRAEMGQPFYRYLCDTRLDLARSLLLEANVTPEAASKRAGFTKYMSFCRAFSRRFGTTPSRLHKEAAASVNELDVGTPEI